MVDTKLSADLTCAEENRDSASHKSVNTHVPQALMDDSSVNSVSILQSSTKAIKPLTDPDAAMAEKDTTQARRFSEPFAKVDGSSSSQRSTSVDLAESLRRGRSFGPLLKPVSKQGIMKSHISSSSHSLQQPASEDGDISEDSAIDTTVISDGDDSEVMSSDDETAEIRGRQRINEEDSGSLKSDTVSQDRLKGMRTTSKSFSLKAKKNLEQSASRERPMTPTPADIENLEEIRKAQRLGVAISTTDMPESHKVIRTIIRGDFGYFQDQAEEELMRVRTYLLAINMKPEAAYATEWTIGTVLRDGDTLMAIFAVDKDAETGLPEDGLAVGEGGKAMRETKAEMDKMTAASRKSSRLFGMKSLIAGPRRSSIAADPRDMKKSKKQQERLHALEKLSDLCIELLRKTKLQVRVVIEVIHCKVARYMLTEAIDVLQPTLVIVGSRGRSVMKGALAGSFSRYLIMKSSVPVMTARMRLSNKKIKSPPPKIRLGNNLIPSRRFADVKIDELEAKLSQESLEEAEK